MLTTLDFIERKQVLNESRYNHDFRYNETRGIVKSLRFLVVLEWGML